MRTQLDVWPARMVIIGTFFIVGVMAFGMTAQPYHVDVHAEFGLLADNRTTYVKSMDINSEVNIVGMARFASALMNGRFQ